MKWLRRILQLVECCKKGKEHQNLREKTRKMSRFTKKKKKKGQRDMKKIWRD